jgi:hypothetical protein
MNRPGRAIGRRFEGDLHARLVDHHADAAKITSQRGAIGQRAEVQSCTGANCHKSARHRSRHFVAEGTPATTEPDSVGPSPDRQNETGGSPILSKPAVFRNSSVLEMTEHRKMPAGLPGSVQFRPHHIFCPHDR